MTPNLQGDSKNNCTWFLHEFGTRNIFSKNNPYRDNFIMEIDCAHPRSVKTLSWSWFIFLDHDFGELFEKVACIFSPIWPFHAIKTKKFFQIRVIRVKKYSSTKNQQILNGRPSAKKIEIYAPESNMQLDWLG